MGVNILQNSFEFHFRPNQHQENYVFESQIGQQGAGFL